MSDIDIRRRISISDVGYRYPDVRYRYPDVGYRIPDVGYKIPDVGYRYRMSDIDTGCLI